jgi:fumarate hydratase class I
LKKGLKKEKRGTPGYYAISKILLNAQIAKGKIPLCQDTGVPVFYIKAPIGTNHHEIRQNIIDATRRATVEIPLRPNAVRTVDDINTNDNVGLGRNGLEIEQPIIYIEQWEKKFIEISLMLKGGGSENVGATYKLPDKALKADRNLEGVRKCIIDAVFRAQGKGCPPYVVGVAVGGSKDVLGRESKRELLRQIDDTNPDKILAAMEEELRNDINTLGIGPVGLGGKTTVLGVKIKALHRHPASFFVDVSFNCWACRRGTIEVKHD